MKIFNFTFSPFGCAIINSNKEFPFIVKPETALEKNNKPFFYPDYTNDLRCCLGIVVKISKLGKCIKEKFASNYYHELSVCVNMVAFDNLMEQINNKMPWDKAISFDNSSETGKFIEFIKKDELQNAHITLSINQNIAISSHFSELPLSINKAIEVVSKYYTVKIGDFLIIEAPCDYKAIQIGDSLCAHISEEKMLEFNIK